MANSSHHYAGNLSQFDKFAHSLFMADYADLSSAIASDSFGGSTTQFDITNPSGSTFRYTYDGTGTDPSITAVRFRKGMKVYLNAQNFNAANTGFFRITGSGANYFEVTNAAGVVESNKTIGTGSCNLCSRFLIGGEFTETDDVLPLPGQVWYCDDAILNLGTNDSLDFNGVTKFAAYGKLTITGTGESASNYQLVRFRGSSYDLWMANLQIVVVPDYSASTDAARKCVQFDTACQNTWTNFLIDTVTIGANTGVGNSFVGIEIDGENNNVYATVRDCTIANGDAIGVSVLGDHNRIDVTVLNTVATVGTADGIDLAVGADYNSVWGVTRGNTTANLDDNGTGNITAGLAI